MSHYLAFAALAALLLAAALIFLLPPLAGLRGALNLSGEQTRREATRRLLRAELDELQSARDKGTLDLAAYEAAVAEVETRAAAELEATHEPNNTAASPAWLWGTAIGVPLAAAAIYLWLGQPAALDPQAIARPEATEHALSSEQINGMVDRLAARLKSQPDDTEGWAMLARSYLALGRFDEAASAYRELNTRVPNNAQFLADQADALAASRGRKFDAESKALVQRALAADADNIKALALAGTVALNEGDKAEAIRHWQRILTLLPPDDPLAEQIKGGIEEASR